MESRSMSVSLKIMIVVSFFVMILVKCTGELAAHQRLWIQGAVSDAFPKSLRAGWHHLCDLGTNLFITGRICALSDRVYQRGRRLSHPPNENRDLVFCFFHSPMP